MQSDYKKTNEEIDSIKQDSKLQDAESQDLVALEEGKAQEEGKES